MLYRFSVQIGAISLIYSSFSEPSALIFKFGKTMSAKITHIHGKSSVSKWVLASVCIVNAYSAYSQETMSDLMSSSTNVEQGDVQLEEPLDVTVEEALTQANRARLKGNTAQAKEWVARAVAAETSDPWLKLKVAEQLVLLGENTQADSVMEQWYQNNPDNNPDIAHVYSVYLADHDHLSRALDVLNAVDKSQYTEPMRLTYTRLQLDKQLADLNKQYLTDSAGANQGFDNLITEYSDEPETLLKVLASWRALGETEQVNLKLNTISPSIDWPLAQQMSYAEALLAAQRLEALSAWKSQVEAHTSFERMNPEERERWRDLRVNYVLAQGLDLEQKGQFEPALSSYYNILASSYPHENTVRIAILRASMKSGTSLKSKHFILQALYEQRDKLTNQELESAIPLLSYYGEQQESEELMVLLSERDDASSEAMLSMMKIAMDNQRWELASQFAVLAFEKENLATSGITLPDIAFPLDNSTMASEQPLRSLYRSTNDSLISMDVRDQVDALRAREDGHVAVGYQQSSNYGKNDVTTIPVEFRIPIMRWDGHLLVRSDYVAVNSGDIQYYSSSAETNTATIDQDQSGWAVGVGYQAEHWRVDMGSTPIGFDHEEMVGGIALNGELNRTEWGVTLSKRPLTASMLSFSGLSVPVGGSDTGVESGSSWGSIMRTGGKLDVSYDQGDVNGAWASAQYHQITGQEVEDNKRMALLGGLYRKLINEDHQRLTIGGDVTWLSYDNNQDSYSYGLGGYYSPQSYVSVALPINYYRIIGNDVTLFSSVSVAHSWSTEDGYLNTNQTQTTSQGIGVSGDIGVEHRLNGHWLIGAQVQGQFDDNYSEVNVGLYTRYNFKESWQKLDLVPHNLIAYSDFD
jgi:hypothetical protein